MEPFEAFSGVMGKLVYSAFKIYKNFNRYIEPVINELLLKETLSNNDLLRIHYYNLEVSKSLKSDIKKKIDDTSFSLDNMKYWKLILE